MFQQKQSAIITLTFVLGTFLALILSGCGGSEKSAKVNPPNRPPDSKPKPIETHPQLHAAAAVSVNFLVTQSIEIALNPDKKSLTDPCLRVSKKQPRSNITEYRLVAPTNCRIDKQSSWTGKLLIKVRRTPCNCSGEYNIHSVEASYNELDYDSIYAGKRQTSLMDLQGHFTVSQNADAPHQWDFSQVMTLKTKMFYTHKSRNTRLFSSVSNITNTGSVQFEQQPDIDEKPNYEMDLKHAALSLHSSHIQSKFRTPRQNVIESLLILKSVENLDLACQGRPTGDLVGTHEFMSTTKKSKKSKDIKNVSLRLDKHGIINLQNKRRSLWGKCKQSQASMLIGLGWSFDMITGLQI